ncbi:MAG: transglycosylase SLT domain-containing protein [bacterium]|nr:transglycosylase SLT domain-containing protein [bacterium]
MADQKSATTGPDDILTGSKTIDAISTRLQQLKDQAPERLPGETEAQQQARFQIERAKTAGEAQQKSQPDIPSNVSPNRLAGETITQYNARMQLEKAKRIGERSGELAAGRQTGFLRFDARAKAIQQQVRQNTQQDIPAPKTPATNLGQSPPPQSRLRRFTKGLGSAIGLAAFIGPDIGKQHGPDQRTRMQDLYRYVGDDIMAMRPRLREGKSHWLDHQASDPRLQMINSRAALDEWNSLHPLDIIVLPAAWLGDLGSFEMYNMYFGDGQQERTQEMLQVESLNERAEQEQGSHAGGHGGGGGHPQDTHQDEEREEQKERDEQRQEQKQQQTQLPRFTRFRKWIFGKTGEGLRGSGSVLARGTSGSLRAGVSAGTGLLPKLGGLLPGIGGEAGGLGGLALRGGVAATAGATWWIVAAIIIGFLLIILLGPLLDQEDQSTTGNVVTEIGCRTGLGADIGDALGITKCSPNQETGMVEKKPYAVAKLFNFSTLIPIVLAQDTSTNDSSSSIGNESDTSGEVNVGFNPTTDVVHRIHVSYPKESKDIIVTYPIQPEVQLIASDPAPNEKFGVDVSQHIDSVTWSLKKVLNPTKSAAELQSMTLPPVDITFKLTLRPRPGVKDIYIVSKALVTLYPLASIGSNGSPDTSGSTDTGNGQPGGSSAGSGCLKISDPLSDDWATINALDSLFLQKVNEVTQQPPNGVGVCVPINLIKALVYEESGGGMLDTNGAGYSGIMQVSPGSWCDHGKYDIATKEGNVGCGVSHLAHTYQQCNNSWEGSVTAYYAGHCIPNGAHDNPAEGGSGETDYQYRDRIINRWHQLDKL